jgi:hypothetical protein
MTDAEAAKLDLAMKELGQSLSVAQEALEKVAELLDDAQLSNVDLQKVLQKQEQVLQMMSNVSKMLYDTAMSVIRKIGG